MGVRSSVIDSWAERPWVDYVVTATVIGAHILAVRGTGSGDWLTWIGSSQRTDMYGAATGAVSAIGGLSAIAIAIYTSANGQRLRTVREQRPDELRRSWRSLLQGTALACALLLTAFSLDRDKDPLSARFIFEYAMVFAALRFSRFIWLFDNIMGISDTDMTEQSSPVTTPARDPNWLGRRQGQSDGNP
ncbi:hypothetical protein [Streptomyces sp. NPDC056013]|uniref:hypothetical protein n=1 Tax=Streptomyces sp. NPDC056013 TaxID=3345680 RepID=UPI0035E1F4E0